LIPPLVATEKQIKLVTDFADLATHISLVENQIGSKFAAEAIYFAPTDKIFCSGSRWSGSKKPKRTNLHAKPVFWPPC